MPGWIWIRGGATTECSWASTKGRREALAMLSRLKESEEFGDALQVKVETGGSSESAEGV